MNLAVVADAIDKWNENGERALTLVTRQCKTCCSIYQKALWAASKEG